MENEKTYWNNKGKYQKQSNFIWMLIPDMGEVKGYDYKVNQAIESIRILNRFYYDIYNNGGWNLCGYESSDSYHTEWYGEYKRELEHLVSFVYEQRIPYNKVWEITGQVKSDIIGNRIDFDKMERFTDYAIIKAFRIIKNHLKNK